MAEESWKMQWWMQPRLPQFSGELDDLSVEDFTMEVDRVLAAYPMGNEMAAYFVFSHLTGTARQEISLRDLQDTNTPEKVTNILMAVFGDQRRTTTLLAEFFGRKQRAGESILDYSHALKKLDRAIGRKDAEALSESLLRDRFVDGLLEPTLRRELRRGVRQSPETTFFETRNEALRWMKEMEEDCRHPVAAESATATLERQVVMLTQHMSVLEESLASLAPNQVPARRRRRRGRNRRKKRSSSAKKSEISKGEITASSVYQADLNIVQTEIGTGKEIPSDRDDDADSGIESEDEWFLVPCDLPAPNAPEHVLPDTDVNPVAVAPQSVGDVVGPVAIAPQSAPSTPHPAPQAPVRKSSRTTKGQNSNPKRLSCSSVKK